MRDKAQIARLVNEMLANNWITKTTNPVDKRSQLLVLTKGGQELVELIIETQDSVHSRMQENLTAEERGVFKRAAAKMSENIKLNSVT